MRTTVVVAAALVLGAVGFWLLSRPRASTNYGTALGAAISARDAAQRYYEETRMHPFNSNALANLLNHGLDERATVMLRLFATNASVLATNIIVVLSGPPNQTEGAHELCYAVLWSGDVVQLRARQAHVGSPCPPGAVAVAIAPER